LSATTAIAQLIDKKGLTLEAAKKVAAAAEEEAIKNKWTVVIAIVDDGSNLVYLQRLDDTVVLSMPGALPIEGGLPLVDDGKVIGAIGVSGVTAQQEGQIAKAGVDALTKLLGR
jgi:uncharacterized protein GlcG (DUF336 family)